MKQKNYKNQSIDDLLKHYLSDDIPPELETRMKDQINLWQAMEIKPRRSTTDFFKSKTIRLIFRKEVIALAAMILVVIGGFLQINGSPNALTSSISILGTSVSMSDQMRSSTSMECKVQASKDGKKSYFYSIQWIAPDLTRVLAEKADRSFSKVLWISAKGIFISDTANNLTRRIDHIDQLKDPVFLPIKDLLSPSELAEKLYSCWQITSRPAQNERLSGKIFVKATEPNTAMEIFYDHSTFLPTRILKTLPESILSNTDINHLDIRFKWNDPIPRQNMLLESKKG